ncbi:MAG: SUMF1/EgtB/PvdO family nonheme iron enzyme [Verrucomicrobia bacterium]|nr:SUMF1/EgtB/PvdO family nonheme iron enzyme [Verrucomicrobiota bacterium]
MIGWKAGTFDLRHGIPPNLPRTLPTNHMLVLLEACRVHDERVAGERSESEPKSVRINQAGAAEILELIIQHRRQKRWKCKLIRSVRVVLSFIAITTTSLIVVKSFSTLEKLFPGFVKRAVIRKHYGGPAIVPAGKFYFQDGQFLNLPGFNIDPTEVTIAEYAEFLAAIGESHEYDHPDQPETLTHRNPQWERLYRTALEGREMDGNIITINFPAVFVNWFDAYAYANWKGRRLPTEQEWEKAARGVDGRRFPWGMETDEGAANIYRSEPGKKWSEPEAYPKDKSPFGVFDMAGNVSEWTSSVGSSGNPVVRGGNFGNSNADVTRRVTNQKASVLSDRIGFRTVGNG